MNTGDEIIRMRTTGQGPRVCLFDVFGTVVDWLGSISSRLASDPALKPFDRDWRACDFEPDYDCASFLELADQLG